jgi:hypothetical protein
MAKRKNPTTVKGKRGAAHLPYDMEGMDPESVSATMVSKRKSAATGPDVAADAFGDGDKPIQHSMDPGVVREIKKRFAPKPKPEQNLTSK